MLTWHVNEHGMKIWRDRELIAHIHPDHYPKLIMHMSRELSLRWDGTDRTNEAEVKECS